MAYNHKKLGKVVADCLNRGGYVSIHYPSYSVVDGINTTPEQALYYMDQARNAFKVEDKALIVKSYEEETIKHIGSYNTSFDGCNISLTSSFVKPSTEEEEDDKS